MTTKTPAGITFTWEDEDLREEGKEDPAFYVWDNHTHICTLSNGTATVHVYCDGEMRANVYENDDPNHFTDDFSIVRYCDRWKEYGINNDAQLFQAQENGRVEWVDSAWFDLYSDDEHLDCVSHTLTEAIQNAVSILDEQDLDNQ